MRGQTIFNTLFAETLPLPTKQEGKGRCPELNTKRDELILMRYYFYGTYTPYRYDLILQTLSSEFFLSERRITDIIAQYAILLKGLRKEQPSIAYMRQQYPHLIWRQIEPPTRPRATL